MRRSVVATALIAAVAMTAAAISGCAIGLGPGPGTKNASVTVTRDFGSQSVGVFVQKHVPGAETVMQLLQRGFKVSNAYGGGFVESVNGLSGGSRRDWFYYVNGIEAPKGAAGTAVHEGDHIWWDLHDWSATDSVPAVVGSFPEPFVNGVGGKRFPTVLDCATDVNTACNLVAHALRQAKVPFADQLLGGGSGSDSLAVVVGTWADLHGVIAADLINAGPAPERRVRALRRPAGAGARAAEPSRGDRRDAPCAAPAWSPPRRSRRSASRPGWSPAPTRRASRRPRRR